MIRLKCSIRCYSRQSVTRLCGFHNHFVFSKGLYCLLTCVIHHLIPALLLPGAIPRVFSGLKVFVSCKQQIKHITSLLLVKRVHALKVSRWFVLLRVTRTDKKTQFVLQLLGKSIVCYPAKRKSFCYGRWSSFYSLVASCHWNTWRVDVLLGNSNLWCCLEAVYLYVDNFSPLSHTHTQ